MTPPLAPLKAIEPSLACGIVSTVFVIPLPEKIVESLVHLHLPFLLMPFYDEE